MPRSSPPGLEPGQDLVDPDRRQRITAGQRRGFLKKGAAWAGGTLAGAAAASSAQAQSAAEPLALPEWTRTQGGPAGTPYGQPSRFEAKVIRRAAEGAQPAFPTAASSARLWPTCSAPSHPMAWCSNATTPVCPTSIPTSTAW